MGSHLIRGGTPEHRTRADIKEWFGKKDNTISLRIINMARHPTPAIFGYESVRCVHRLGTVVVIISN